MAQTTDDKPVRVEHSEPEPTRPSWKMLVAAVAVFLAFEGASHWPQISTFAHLPQIEHSLGIG